MDVDNVALGRIITLMPKIQQSLRLNPETVDVIQQIADKLNKKRTEVLEIAIVHLDQSLRNGNPIYIVPAPPESGPDQPKSHKRRRSAA